MHLSNWSQWGDACSLASRSVLYDLDHSMLYSGALTKKPKPVAIKSRNHTSDNRFGESMLYQETTEKIHNQIILVNAQ